MYNIQYKKNLMCFSEKEFLELENECRTLLK